jgi:hypothetical protein
MTLEKTMNGTNGNGNSGAMVRQEQFGGTSLATVQETASQAMAAHAKAAVEARSIMAMRNPRNLDQVRSELLRECARPKFAEVARYRKPIGQGIEGLSIRFVEQALQILGNCESSAVTVYDDDEKRIVQITVMDYERNVCHSKQITVGKHVERSKLRHGQSALGRRTGSNGQTVYIVAATDDDLLNKEAALVSKALRTCGLRLIPGWLQDEAEQAIKATAANDAAVDPDLKKKQVADAFAALNVTTVDLEEYLGHDLSKVSPAGIDELKQVYTTIKDGQATWQDTIEHKREQRGDNAPKAAADTPKAGKGAQGIKDRLVAKLSKEGTTLVNQDPAKLEAEAKAREAKVAELDAKEKAAAHEAKITATNEAVEAKAKAKVAKDQAAAEEQPAGDQAATKRPSRSKAAQAVRAAEVEPMGLPPSKCLTYYVSNGDPRNLAKAKAMAAKATDDVIEGLAGEMDAQEAAEDKMADEAKAAAEHQRKQALLDEERLKAKAAIERKVETTADGTRHDATTGEVLDDNPNDEPAWMRQGPPPDEEF